MKILLVNHEDAGEWGGGDGVQMRETAKGLRQRGHNVELVNADQPDVSGFDLVHIFNCRVQESFYLQMQSCLQAGVPVVVSPIWISIGRALWGSRASNAIFKQAVESGNDSIEGLLTQLKERRLAVELSDGECIEAHGHQPESQKSFRIVGNLLNQSNGLLPNSWLELKAIQSDLQWRGNTFEVANYGVDPKLFLDANPEIFREVTGINEPFVLQAGRIEPGKNQAMLCWAMREVNLPIVLIGGSRHWPSYAELCKQIIGDRLIIIDHLTQPLLASAYAAAGVHVLPSWMETCGLVTLEAALSGTPVVGSNFGHELEYLKNDAWYCDPGDPESVRNAVLAAWEEGKQGKRASKLKNRVLCDYNWENTTSSTEFLYQRVLSENA